MVQNDPRIVMMIYYVTWAHICMHKILMPNSQNPKWICVPTDERQG